MSEVVRTRQTIEDALNHAAAAPPPRRIVRREIISTHVMTGDCWLFNLTRDSPEWRTNSDGSRSYLWREKCEDCGQTAKTGTVTEFDQEITE